MDILLHIQVKTTCTRSSIDQILLFCFFPTESDSQFAAPVSQTLKAGQLRNRVSRCQVCKKRAWWFYILKISPSQKKRKSHTKCRFLFKIVKIYGSDTRYYLDFSKDEIFIYFSISSLDIPSQLQFFPIMKLLKVYIIAPRNLDYLAEILWLLIKWQF